MLYILYRLIGLVGKVFANDPGDLGSIPSRVIPKTLKMVLYTSLLNTQQYTVRIKSKVEQSRKRVAPSPTTQCSSYWEESLRVALDYGRQLYFYLCILWIYGHYMCCSPMVRGDLGSIPGRVIPKTQKMVLDASLLSTQHYKVRIKGKVEQSREGVAPSPTTWCSSYRKGSFRVTLDYGRQLYFTFTYIYIYICVCVCVSVCLSVQWDENKQSFKNVWWIKKCSNADQHNSIKM